MYDRYIGPMNPAILKNVNPFSSSADVLAKAMGAPLWKDGLISSHGGVEASITESNFFIAFIVIIIIVLVIMIWLAIKKAPSAQPPSTASPK